MEIGYAKKNYESNGKDSFKHPKGHGYPYYISPIVSR